MSQEMNILCCYSCKIFQVHIVKKAKKWQCKVCNEKQSFQRVYFKGSGKDCRIQVQNLNSMRQNECQASTSFQKDDTSDTDCENDYAEQHQSEVVQSKWTKYLDSSKEETEVKTLESINDNNSSSKGDTDNSMDTGNDDSTYIYSENDSIDDSCRSEDNLKPKFNILLKTQQINVETERNLYETFPHSCNSENTSSFNNEGSTVSLKRKNFFEDEDEDDDDFDISIDF